MTADKLLQLNLPLFEGLTPEDLSVVNLTHREQTLKPWEILFSQYDTSRDVYFLLSGTLLAVYWTEEGREVIFNRFLIGAYFGELAALDGGNRSLAITAMKETRIVSIPQNDFLELFDKVPLVRNRIAYDLVAKVRSLTERNLELTTYSVEQRVASYLIRLAMEQNLLKAGGIIKDAPTHGEIAASIGANREMVSRTLTRLKQKGALKTGRKRIEICSPEKLSSAI
ncbi:Transcriptional activator protein Anr [Roseovarius albus]|uniref:Transcriptional activator protein Anr n=1 Tax=Roseovarius albus TaxID=1247867 RepID=A0A1X6ZXW0_9RHOB|nr:Crp/Fnr family transcriptional regulator [Roseovarius albus]SLN64306.1 Transcriptional activator protein Anr [Roseovarius albus]